MAKLVSEVSPPPSPLPLSLLTPPPVRPLLFLKVNVIVVVIFLVTDETDDVSVAVINVVDVFTVIIAVINIIDIAVTTVHRLIYSVFTVIIIVGVAFTLKVLLPCCLSVLFLYWWKEYEHECYFEFLLTSLAWLVFITKCFFLSFFHSVT